jgi:hypothetical protein
MADDGSALPKYKVCNLLGAPLLWRFGNNGLGTDMPEQPRCYSSEDLYTSCDTRP